MTSEVLTSNKIQSPFAIKWTIAEAKLVALKDSNNGFLDSEKFEASNIPDIKYYLRIYPYGFKERNPGKTCICLYLESKNGKKVKADYKYIIESVDFAIKMIYEYGESLVEGQGMIFCGTEELFDPSKKFIIDGKFTVKCEGILKVEREIADDEDEWENSALGSELWEEENKDFTIMVDEKPIQVHKNVLSARSPVFKGMFNSGMKEVAESQMNIIDFSFDIVEAALQLLYDRKLTSLTLEEKLGVLQFFDKYQILKLKSLIEASLIENISTSNVCRIANSSIISNTAKLQKKCLDFLVDCLKKSQMVAELNTLDHALSAKVLENAFYKTTET